MDEDHKITVKVELSADILSEIDARVSRAVSIALGRAKTQEQRAIAVRNHSVRRG